MRRPLRCMAERLNRALRALRRRADIGARRETPPRVPVSFGPFEPRHPDHDERNK